LPVHQMRVRHLLQFSETKPGNVRLLLKHGQPSFLASARRRSWFFPLLTRSRSRGGLLPPCFITIGGPLR
jgi:hypothetical protein